MENESHRVEDITYRTPKEEKKKERSLTPSIRAPHLVHDRPRGRFRKAIRRVGRDGPAGKVDADARVVKVAVDQTGI